MIRRPPRSTQSRSSAASDVYKRQAIYTPSDADLIAGTVTLTYTTNDQTGICSPVESSMILTIKKAVDITSQPSNTSICASYSGNLNVVATGDGLTYQWYKGAIGSGVAIVNSSNITGATGSSLNFTRASLANDAGPYYAIVSGASPCAAVTTDQVTLMVDQNIDITTEPITQTVCENTYVSLTVTADAGGD